MPMLEADRDTPRWKNIREQLNEEAIEPVSFEQVDEEYLKQKEMLMKGIRFSAFLQRFNLDQEERAKNAHKN